MSYGLGAVPTNPLIARKTRAKVAVSPTVAPLANAGLSAPVPKPRPQQAAEFKRLQQAAGAGDPVAIAKLRSIAAGNAKFQSNVQYAQFLLQSLSATPVVPAVPAALPPVPPSPVVTVPAPWGTFPSTEGTPQPQLPVGGPGGGSADVPAVTAGVSADGTAPMTILGLPPLVAVAIGGIGLWFLFRSGRGR
jgi:hypothetical protein